MGIVVILIREVKDAKSILTQNQQLEKRNSVDWQMGCKNDGRKQLRILQIGKENLLRPLLLHQADRSRKYVFGISRCCEHFLCFGQRRHLTRLPRLETS